MIWAPALVQRLAEHSRRVLQATRRAAEPTGGLDEFGPPGPGPGGKGAPDYLVIFDGYFSQPGLPNYRLWCRRIGANNQPVGDAFNVAVTSIPVAGSTQLIGSIDLDNPAAPVFPKLTVGQLFWVRDRDGQPYLCDVFFTQVCVRTLGVAL